MNPAHIPIYGTTQQHLPIEDIKDDLVILKDGSCCLVLQTNAVNFNLLSETEQEAIIYAYAGLLNSLSFPLQILVRSKKKDISSYLTLLKKQKEKQKSPYLKEWISHYHQFVEKIVKESEILEKKFYLIISFSSLEMGITPVVKTGLFGSKREEKLPFPKEYILQKAKTSLYPKRDHLIKQFNRLGLKVFQINTQQLIELFYEIYNAESEGQKFTTPKDYSSFFVNYSPPPSSDKQTPFSQKEPENIIYRAKENNQQKTEK